MNFCAPETLVRINVADASQDGLIQQQRLDTRSTSTNPSREFLSADFQRVGPEIGELSSERRGGDIRHATEAAWIGVAKLSPVIERHPHMCVLLMRLFGARRGELPGHTEMHEQRRGG